ncbi:hypothetical protein P7K49_032314 [Saguinus oedipus]|uniref:Uncharacterized protein n=1 Tax=Saguinus oedipus TaxID=9490 RepID=A0ABQ9TZ49_SAGOE|nr:hypothetical protein P7K49_032314 [Saguinus oedipus]
MRVVVRSEFEDESGYMEDRTAGNLEFYCSCGPADASLGTSGITKAWRNASIPLWKRMLSVDGVGRTVLRESLSLSGYICSPLHIRQEEQVLQPWTRLQDRETTEHASDRGQKSLGHTRKLSSSETRTRLGGDAGPEEEKPEFRGELSGGAATQGLRPSSERHS